MDITRFNISISSTISLGSAIWRVEIEHLRIVQYIIISPTNCNATYLFNYYIFSLNQ